MGTVAKVHYWKIVEDDTMDEHQIRELIALLEDYMARLA